MFYVYTKNGTRYGVVDTNDGICEYYSEKQLIDLSNKGVKIFGVSDNSISVVDTNFIRAKAKLLGIKISDYILDSSLGYSIEKRGRDFYLVSSLRDKINISSQGADFISFITQKLMIYNLWNSRYFDMNCSINDVFVAMYDTLEPLTNVAASEKKRLAFRYDGVEPKLKAIYRRGTSLILGVGATSNPDNIQYFSVHNGYIKKCYLSNNCMLYTKVV